MKNLFKANVDTSTVDNLMSGTLVPIKVVTGTLMPNKGILQRGTLLTLAGAGYDVYTPETTSIRGILLNDIDTDDADEIIGAAIATSGEFNQNKIEEVMDIDVPNTDIYHARNRQIYIAPMNEAPEAFNP